MARKGHGGLRKSDIIMGETIGKKRDTYVESKGYVAVDFYDGSLLYNLNANETKICDIDVNDYV